MIEKRIDKKNAYVIQMDDNSRFYKSYTTIIAAMVDGVFYITNKKYSRTTTRHEMVFQKLEGYPCPRRSATPRELLDMYWQHYVKSNND